MNRKFNLKKIIDSLELLSEVLRKHSVVVNVTILRPTGKALTIWVPSYGVNSTEMTLDSSEHLVVYYVEQFHFESSLLLSSGCDIFSILSSTH